MKNTRVAAVAAPALLLFALAGCAAPAASTTAADCEPEWDVSTIEDGVLTVASVGALPYLDIAPGSTEAGGIDGELYSLFAERACLEARFTALGGPAAVAALTEGQADAGAGGWYATPERGESIGQTDAVWFNYTGIIADAATGSVADLDGKKVGVVGGSVYVEPLGAAVGADNVAQYQTADALFQDLDAGRIAAGVGTAAELSALVEERGSEAVVTPLEFDEDYPELTSVGNVNLPHAKDNASLHDALVDFVADIRADGTVEKILAEYGITDPSYYEAAAE